MTMSDSVQEFMITTPGLSPKKIFNSSVANGFHVREQKGDLPSSPLKRERKISSPKKRDRAPVTNGVHRVVRGGLKIYLN